MAHQFIHYESYGLVSRGGKNTARGVVMEAERMPTHSKHVEKPKHPKLIFGANPSQLLNELEQAAQKASDRTGKRKLPKDAKILLAGVVSMPLKSADFLQAYEEYKKSGMKDSPVSLKNFGKWQNLTLKFLQNHYGDGLRSVVIHYDEEYMHMHYYAANKLTGGTLNLDGLDDAADAERALGLDRASRNKQGAARKTVRAKALRLFQDSYYEAVGKVLGWSRLGPKNPRMTKQQYAQQKAGAKALMEEKLRTNEAFKLLAVSNGKLETSRAMYQQAVEEIAPDLAQLSREVQRLKHKPNPSQVEAVEAKLTALAKRIKLKL
jgi:hypothetical protein